MRYVSSLVVLLTFAAQASASLQIINGAGATTIPSNNNFQQSFINDLGLNWIFNGGADVKVTQNGTITFYYHGAESGYSNKFVVGSSDLHTENSPGFSGAASLNLPGLAIGQISVSANDTFSGLGIGFKVAATNGVGGTPIDALAGTPGFAVFFASPFNANDTFAQLYIGFDDNGAGPDDNHDDMIVSALFEAKADGVVPEAASLATWGGLICVAGFAVRRVRGRNNSA